MKGKRSGSEQEFFLTGVMTCLDVMEALEEFRRQVQERCRDTVKSRLNDLSAACGIEWKAEDLRDYSETEKTGADRAHFLGVKIAIASLGVLSFYLGMERQNGELAFATWTQLLRHGQSVASDLWTLMLSSDPEAEHTSSSLIFGSELLEDHLPNFEQHLNQAIDGFVNSIANAGGLKKYLPE